MGDEDKRGMGQDPEKTFEQYRQGAERGQPDCLRALGECYAAGNGVARDMRKAVEYYTRAAEMGDGRAMYNLGQCYQFAKGTDGNMGRAVEWYEKSLQVRPDRALAEKVQRFKEMAKIDPHFYDDYPQESDDVDDEAVVQELMGRMTAANALGVPMAMAPLLIQEIDGMRNTYEGFVRHVRASGEKPDGKVRLVTRGDELIGFKVLDFDIEGTQYEGRIQRIENVCVGDPVRLARDPGNPHRSDAIQVLNRSGESLGLLPGYTLLYIADALDQGWITVRSARVISVEPLSKRSKRAKRPLLNIEAEFALVPPGTVPSTPGSEDRAKPAPAPAAPPMDDRARENHAILVGNISKIQAALNQQRERTREAERKLSDLQAGAERSVGALEADRRETGAKWDREIEQARSHIAECEGASSANIKALQQATGEFVGLGLFAFSRKKALAGKVQRLRDAQPRLDGDIAAARDALRSAERDRQQALDQLEAKLAALKASLAEAESRLQAQRALTAICEQQLAQSTGALADMEAGRWDGVMAAHWQMPTIDLPAREPEKPKEAPRPKSRSMALRDRVIDGLRDAGRFVTAAELIGQGLSDVPTHNIPIMLRKLTDEGIVERSTDDRNRIIWRLRDGR